MKRGKPTAMMLFLVVLITSTQASATQVANFTVSPHSTSYIKLALPNGVTLNGSISTTSSIRFFVSSPTGQPVVNLGIIDNSKTFSFTAKENGSYILNFENGLVNSADVSLSYGTEPEIPGSNNFLGSITIGDLVTIISIAAIVIILVSYVILRRRRRTDLPENQIDSPIVSSVASHKLFRPERAGFRLGYPTR